MKLDLLTNATVVDDAIRFVSEKSKDKVNVKSHPRNNSYSNEESNEPNYEDKEQLDLEEKEETGEITTRTWFSEFI
jgi:hypothetical protein